MKEVAKKVLKTGFGLGLLTLEKAKKAAVLMREELDLSEEESKRLALQLMRSSRDTAEEVLNIVGKHFEEAVVKSGLAKKSELKAVKNVVKKRVLKLVKRKRR